MKLIILQHEEKYNSSLFFTPLTEQGKNNSNKLKDILPENIDIIFSSPFLRTLETIYPYCKKYNKKVNTENAFYEFCEEPDFNTYNYRHWITEYKKTNYYYLNDIINNNYKSKIFVSNILFPEDKINIQNRVFPFIYNICKKYKNTDKTILIVTHKTICNFIKKCFNKNHKIDSEFLMGSFEEITISKNWKGLDGYVA